MLFDLRIVWVTGKLPMQGFRWHDEQPCTVAHDVLLEMADHLRGLHRLHEMQWCAMPAAVSEALAREVVAVLRQRVCLHIVHVSF